MTKDGPPATAAEVLCRTYELYTAALATRDPALAEQCAANYHPAAQMSATVAGRSALWTGREGIRTSIREGLADGTTQRHVDYEVVEDGATHAVVRSTFVVSQDGKVLIAVRCEDDVVLRDGLIIGLRIRQLPDPQGEPPPWLPLGPHTGAVGEIVALWEDSTILVRLYDGRVIELPLTEAIAAHSGVGQTVIVYSLDGAALGWYLPDAKLGVDMRGEPE